MDTTRTERIRLGIFLLICLGAAVGFTVFIAEQQLADKKTEYYTVFHESVIGLSIDAKVLLNGIEVGNVTQIHIDSTNLGNVVVRFNVKEGTPIKTGTRTRMTHGISLTGLKDLVLSGGEVSEADIPAGGYVQAGDNMLAKISDKAEETFDRVAVIMDQLSKILSEDNANHISNTLKNLESMSANANKITREIQSPMKEIEASAQSLHQTRDDLNKAEIAKKIEDDLVLIQAKMQELDVKSINENTVSALKSVSDMTKRADMVLYNNQDRLSEVLDQLNAVLSNLSVFSQKIKQNPSALIRESKQTGR